MLKVNLFTSFLSSLPTPKALHLFPRKHLLAGVAQVSGQRSFYEILSVPRGPPLRTSIKNAVATFFFWIRFPKDPEKHHPGAEPLLLFHFYGFERASGPRFRIRFPKSMLRTGKRLLLLFFFFAWDPPRCFETESLAGQRC